MLRLLTFPFRPRPLALLAGSAALAPATVIPAGGPAVGLLMAVTLLHFGFRLLDQTVLGMAPAPRPTLRPDGPALVRTVALLGTLMAYGALGLTLLVLTRPVVLGLFLPMMAALLPAVILVTGRERRLFSALLAGLHPVLLGRTIRLLGRPYWAPVAVLLLLVAGGAGAALAEPLPLWALLAGGGFWAGYGMLFLFRAAGGLGAVWARGLGYPAVGRPAVLPTPPAKAEPVRRERVAELVRENRLTEAARLLREEVLEAPEDLNRWERLYGVLRALEQDGPFLAGSRAFITALLRAGREERALEVAQDGLNRDPAFRPSRPEQVHPLALAARTAGRPRLALRLMNRFSHRYPDHPDVPAVVLLSGRILKEDFRQGERARRTLASLLRRYPDHPAAAEARTLLSGLAEAS
ncbi:tetratricopeptide repeat protein [Thiohalorhabdus sp. Cl-TMA]|uniref:Tol-pal system YbgF family protein n=1 Tax=Thiohalorhabdus methylotrophus TaxID=3242694 RepID=A0ABV4TSD2_9GAMM